MGLKKANANLTLFLVTVLIVHVFYEVWAFLNMYHNAAISGAFGGMVLLAALIHGGISFKMVFRDHDSHGKVEYGRLNARTVVQRATATGMGIFLPLHCVTMMLIMNKKGGVPVLILLLVSEVLFWLFVAVHVTLSFSNALITLGVLADMKKRKKVDITAGIICALTTALSSYVIIMTQLALFFAEGNS